MARSPTNVASLLQDPFPGVARRDREVLLSEILGRNRAWLMAHPEAELGDAEFQQWTRFLERRAAGEPLQYITGRQEFFGLALQVSPAVLIPRPETELLVEAVLERLSASGESSPLVVDVGTGSGAIALALASRLPLAQILALDLSEAALEAARQNAVQLGLGHVRFERSDLLEAVSGAVDCVVSNPPYIPLADLPTLQPEVRAHEPHLALFGGEDGLSVYRRLIPQASAVLRTGGLLALEIGFGQQPALEALLSGWEAVAFHKDYAGIPRMVLARRA